MYLVFKSFAERKAAGSSQPVILGEVRNAWWRSWMPRHFVLVPPAIPGLGVSGGFQMQLQLQGGSTDLDVLARSTRSLIEAARSQSGIGALNTSFRADVPQIFVDVDRNQAESLGVPIGNIFSTLQSYTGSTYVNQFNLFNQSYQTYIQADSRVPAAARGHRQLKTRNKAGEMVPLGALADFRYVAGCGHHLALQSLPDGRPQWRPRAGLQLRPGAAADGAGGRRPAAGQYRLCLDRHVAAGEDRRQPGDLHLRAVGAAGLSGAGGALRELDQPDGGDHGRAAGAAGRRRRDDGPPASPTTCTARSASF